MLIATRHRQLFRSVIFAGLIVVVIGTWWCSGLNQPILENYVGRQIPTAMVSRNLERGSGFFQPLLDTGPFPNRFLVEPPIYAQTAATLSRMSAIPLEPCGRLVSVIGLILACWGIAGIGKTRPGDRDAVAVFWLAGYLPVFIRYGRAFQPDVLALGLVLAGARLWDRYEMSMARGSDDDSTESAAPRSAGRSTLVSAWLLTATGLATKVSTAYALIPLIAVILKPRTPSKVALALSTLAPALLWYAYAGWIIRQGEGSRASADNAANWLSALSLVAWTKAETYRVVARMAGWRAFGPIGLPLALWGLSSSWPGVRYWRAWLLSAMAALVLLGGKLHHEYYFVALAPAVLAGCPRSGEWFGRLGPWLGERLAAKGPRSLANPYLWLTILITSMLLAIVVGIGAHAMKQTKETPREWAAWPYAVEVIKQSVSADEWLAAPEALLYLADRKGCRLEYEPRARLRAAGEWGATIDPNDPLALVELYRSKGARFVADLWPVTDEPDRRALHEAIRGRYNVLVDDFGVILAELVEKRK
jgi:hypothetical protein